MTQTEKKLRIQRVASRALGYPEGTLIPFESISNSDLRLEQVLTTQSQILFNVLVNTGTTLASEIRLNLNDGFVITHIGLKVAKVAAASPTANQVVNKRLYSYANPFIFDGAAGDANIPALYNSQFSFTVNETAYIPSLHTLNFMRIGDAQEGSQTGVMTGPAYSRQAMDSLPNGLYGLWETDEILITGTQKIKPVINLPAGFTSTFTEANEVNYAVLLLKGYLLQNCGSFSAR